MPVYGSTWLYVRDDFKLDEALERKKIGSLSVECIWKRCLKQLFPPPSTKHQIIKFFKTPLGFGKCITCNELHWTFGTSALWRASLKQVLVFHCVRNSSQWSAPLLCQVRPLMLGHRSPTGMLHTVLSVHDQKQSGERKPYYDWNHALFWVLVEWSSQGSSAYMW